MAATLSDVHKVYQDGCLEAFRFAVEHGDSVCIFGPSGGGKTTMAFTAVEELDCNPVYINLSVLERPDFQGWPAPSAGQLTVTYATPDFLPFEDTKYYGERKALEKLIAVYEGIQSPFINQVESRLKDIEMYERQIAIKKALPYLEDDEKLYKSVMEELNSLIKNSPKMITSGRPNVLIFDEADKAPHEVLQPLLEVTQFHKVNGRPLNIRGCFLLCNLPDEHANTETLSHALTKRCKVLRLDLAFDQWKRWAFKANLHALIIGFLANNVEFLHKTDIAKQDPTAYAQPTPRSWEYASNTLIACEKKGYPLFDANAGMDDRDSSDSITTSLIASHVGLHAALKLENWVKYYHTLDPVIDGIANKGIEIGEKLSFDQQLVVALGACSRVKKNLTPEGKKEAIKTAKNVFRWLKSCADEIQIGALRGAFDWEEVKDYKLTDIKEVQEVVDTLTEKLS